MHRVIAARQPLIRMEAALVAMRAHTTRPKPCRTPTFAPLQSDGRWHLPWTVCFSQLSAVIHRSVAADQPCYRRPASTKLLLQSRNNKFRGNLPCCCICWRNLTTTLEEGRMRTCLLPRFWALVIVLIQPASTDIRTIWEFNDCSSGAPHHICTYIPTYVRMYVRT